MTKLVIDAAMDALLDNVGDNVNALHVCSGNPATRPDVITLSLGNVAIDNTDMTKSNGAVSGRRGTWAAQSIGSASNSGTAAVVCLIDATNLRLKTDLVTTQSVTTGNPLTVGQFDHEVEDPI